MRTTHLVVAPPSPRRWTLRREPPAGDFNPSDLPRPSCASLRNFSLDRSPGGCKPSATPSPTHPLPHTLTPIPEYAMIARTEGRDWDSVSEAAAGAAMIDAQQRAFGALLKRFRLAASLSQADLAKRA